MSCLADQCMLPMLLPFSMLQFLFPFPLQPLPSFCRSFSESNQRTHQSHMKQQDHHSNDIITGCVVLTIKLMKLSRLTESEKCGVSHHLKWPGTDWHLGCQDVTGNVTCHCFMVDLCVQARLALPVSSSLSVWLKVGVGVVGFFNLITSKPGGTIIHYLTERRGLKN